MRLGLLARADQRGIGHVTREFAEHMSPDRVLVLRVPKPHACFPPPHPEDYGRGSVWQCDACGALYRRHVDPHYGLPDWRWVSPRRARRLLRRNTPNTEGNV